jgi:metal-dependent amidase/aminoacylase/carboxypeptidase family protein
MQLLDGTINNQIQTVVGHTGATTQALFQDITQQGGVAQRAAVQMTARSPTPAARRLLLRAGRNVAASFCAAERGIDVRAGEERRRGNRPRRATFAAQGY